MSEEIIRLYEYDQEKPDIESALAHFGIKGQKWGVRRYQNLDGTYTDAGRKRYGFKSRRKKAEKTYKNREDAIEARDLKYINAHKSNYSTKELNDLMNRINTEQRLSDMANSSNKKAKKQVEKIFKSNTFKMAATVGVAALVITGANFFEWLKASDNELLYPELKNSTFNFGKELKKTAKDIGNMAINEKVGKYKKFLKKY